MTERNPKSGPTGITKLVDDAYGSETRREIAKAFDFPIDVTKEPDGKITLSLSLDALSLIDSALLEYGYFLMRDLDKSPANEAKEWVALADHAEAIRQVFAKLQSVARDAPSGSYTLLFDGEKFGPSEPN